MSDDAAERAGDPAGGRPPPDAPDTPAASASDAAAPPTGPGRAQRPPAEPPAVAGDTAVVMPAARTTCPEPPPVAGDTAPAVPTARTTRPAASAGWTDERVEAWIGAVLRLGVALAAVVASVGSVFFLARYGAQPADYRTFHGVAGGLDSVGGVLAGALALRSRWIIQLGLLLLIATPIARVALSLVAFALQRDRTYVVLTALVLALLLFSLMGPGF